MQSARGGGARAVRVDQYGFACAIDMPFTSDDPEYGAAGFCEK